MKRWTGHEIVAAYCFAHARRKFYELADFEKYARNGKKGTPPLPEAKEAVRRIDELLKIESEIIGKSAEERLAIRKEVSVPLFDDLEKWLTDLKKELPRSSPLLKPINYMLSRWDGFATFTKDGKACMTNNAAERGMRGIAIGRRVWLFAGSEVGAERCAFMNTLFYTCRLNEIDPKAWMADVLARLPDLPMSRLHELLPWEWKRIREEEARRREAENRDEHQPMVA